MKRLLIVFSVTKTLVQNLNNIYYLPSQTTTGDDYYLLNKVLCYQGGVLQGQAEKVSINKIDLLNKSILTSPSNQYPSYTQKGDSITIFPITFNGALDIQGTYVRYPLDPKWTYVNLLNGEPLFDQTQNDYQDFELPIDDLNNLVARILQYAGVSIREADVVQFGQIEEQQQNQTNT